ncbi:alpha/beta fold hydrolase [Aureisphaera galaxeae]|uniref:alpha/beta fold hydrolase n=1 Tax=Aureisphaera galaxeae TaxID=1538023 RepID=UPI002350CB57|nr:alpha/beta fold hydrolase [Aureisphaera galaxeae]MDC8005743.1 alpha/beta fold hydrolase [Aureisphaera galaxeae]
MILHSQIIGEGIPFVILHGFLGMSDNWKTLGRKFAEMGYQVHLVDQRNHGRSFHADEFSYALMSEDLSQYCQHHGLTEIALLGHSMGGKTAMEFATTHEEQVSQLMVADIAPKSYPQHHHEILKALAMLDFNEIKSRGKADEKLAEYIPELGTRQFLLKNLYWKEKGQLGLRINLEVLTEKNTEIGKALPENATFSKDTLFVRGEQSGYIETYDEILIKKHFPQAKSATVPQAGHWLHADNPKDFLEIIANFLQKEI